MDIKLVLAALPASENLSAWCRRFGVSRQQAYVWRRRFAAGGLEALADRPRVAQHIANRLGGEVEDAIVRWRKQLSDGGLDAGAASIWDAMKAAGEPAPSEATIWRVLQRRGLIEANPRKRPRASLRRFAAERPNELWQIDATHWSLGDGTVVEIVNVIDDHSRVCVASLAAPVTTALEAIKAVTRGIARWGCPAAVLSDNGRVFNGRTGDVVGLFERHLRARSIRALRSTPYHPQTCGKVERFHQTLKKWLDAQPAAATIAELQHSLDVFVQLYNHQRPHRAVARRPPAEAWAATPPALPTPSSDTDVLAWHGLRVGTTGNVKAGDYLIQTGARAVGRTVTVLIIENHCLIIDDLSGHTWRNFTLDRDRRYQPNGRAGSRKNQN